MQVLFRFPLICLAFAVCLPAAKAQFLDSIRSALNQKPSPYFKIDSRNSFIADQSAKILGFKAGAEFANRLRIGSGYNLLTRHSPGLDEKITLQSAEYKAILKFSYLALYMDYVYYKTKRWEAAVSVQLGAGFSKYQYTAADGAKVQMNKKSVVLYELGIEGTYKVTKWFGIGLGTGMRIMLVNNNAIDKKFNSAIYILKFRIFPKEVYRLIF